MEDLKEEFKRKVIGLFDVDEIDFFMCDDGSSIDGINLKEWYNKNDRYKVALQLIDAGCTPISF